MKRWLLKIVVLACFLSLFHLGNRHHEAREAALALDPFLFLANYWTGVVSLAGPAVLAAGLISLHLCLVKRRLFCRFLCPLGFLQDILRAVRSASLKRLGGRPGRGGARMRIFQPIGMVLALAAFGGIFWGGFTFLWLDPLVIVDGAHYVSWCRYLLAGILLSVLFFPRLWCFFLCPCGGMQELLWLAAAPIRQLVKFLKSARDPRGAGSPGAQTNAPDAQTDSPGTQTNAPGVQCGRTGAFRVSARRRFFQTAGVLALTALAVGSLRKALQDTLAKASDFFVRFRPPGAVGERDLLIRCTRCGKCAGVCPTHLIETVSDLAKPQIYGTPTLNFGSETVGEGRFCEENCVRCTEVCPTGALLRVPLEKKSTLRIAECRFQYDLCRRFFQMECSICLQACPYGALEEVWSEDAYAKIPSVNADLCIGCGKCAAVCPGEPLLQIDPATGSPVGWGAGIQTEDGVCETTGKKALTMHSLRGLAEVSPKPGSEES